jgi:hypothetical protein
MTGAKNSRKITLFWCVICGGSLMAAFIVGISGNMPGLVLCYVAAISIILAFVHTWKRVKLFLFLSGGALAGFVVFAVLHNLFYAFGQMAANIIVLKQLLESLHVIFFVAAVLVCPAGFLIGVVGSIVTAIMYSKRRRIQNKAG